MSPRAAWQLEALGFKDVYDFVSGKAEWISRGLPVEGTGPHYPLAGEAARRDIVYECRLGSRVGSLRAAVGESGQSYCVVLNDQDILIGRLRKRHLQSGDEKTVENVMEIGPTTVRATESAAALLKRMDARSVPAVLVTTAKGRFIGIARRTELERLVRASAVEQYAGQERRR
jgi:CBS domain-containing protein